MSKLLFQEFVDHQGLASEAAARRRFDKVAKIIEEQNIHTMVIVIDGRFAPVVRLREGQTHLMHTFIGCKIGVC